jgi:hypothetical protein
LSEITKKHTEKRTRKMSPLLHLLEQSKQGGSLTDSAEFDAEGLREAIVREAML